MPPTLAEIACDHAERCAGCPLIGAPYAEQLETKRELVTAALRPYAELDCVVEATAGADPREGYRVRAKLMVSADDRDRDAPTPIIGLYERVEKGAPTDATARTRRSAAPGEGDHVVVDIPRCRVLGPRIAAIVTTLRAVLQRPPSEAGACLVPEKLGGALSAIDVREISGGGSSRAAPSTAPHDESAVAHRAGVLVTLVLCDAQHPSENELAAAAAAVRALDPDVLGVAVNYRAANAPQVLGRQTQILSGAEAARDAIGPAYHVATYGSFVQAHRGQAERIQRLLVERLATLGIAGDASLLDLYGGSGALSLPFATRGAKVTLIEAFGPAAEAAARAAREQGAARFAVRQGDAARTLADLVREGASFDAVLTNPPRRGMAPDARRAVAALGPRAIAYVSCDPETLARDLAHFSYLGYVANHLQPVDMIPLTEHVETVALLTPCPPRMPSVHHEGTDLRITGKPAHMPSRAWRGGERIVWASAEQASGFCVSTTLASSANWTFCAVYIALVRGITARRGSCGKRATYERTAKLNGHSLLQITLEISHKSDLMRDLARLDHPVIGDRRWGHFATNRHFEERYTLDRPFLHCVELTVAEKAATSSLVRTQSDLPGELATVLNRLGHLPSMSSNE